MNIFVAKYDLSRILSSQDRRGTLVVVCINECCLIDPMTYFYTDIKIHIANGNTLDDFKWESYRVNSKKDTSLSYKYDSKITDYTFCEYVSIHSAFEKLVIGYKAHSPFSKEEQYAWLSKYKFKIPPTIDKSLLREKIHFYIEERKLEEAFDLLIDNKDKISSVARNTSFSLNYRYENLKEFNRKALISFEEYQKEFGQIVFSLMQMSDLLSILFLILMTLGQRRRSHIQDKQRACLVRHLNKTRHLEVPYVRFYKECA